MSTTETAPPTMPRPMPNGVPSAGSNTSPQAKVDSTPTHEAPVGTNSAPPTIPATTPSHASSAGSQSSPQATLRSTPIAVAPAGTLNGGSGQVPAGTQKRAPEPLDFSLQAIVAAMPTADSPAGITSTPPTKTGSTSNSVASAGSTSRPAGATAAATPMPEPPRLGGDNLALFAYADIVSDLERVRIATSNRLFDLTRNNDPDNITVDPDGVVRGGGLDGDHPDAIKLTRIRDGLAGVEHQAILELQKAMRHHPLGPWLKAQKGIGEKQGARLLAAIGDPYWNSLHDRPRTVSELWAYCGLHTLPAGHAGVDTQPPNASGDQLPAGHGDGDTHTASAGRNQTDHTGGQASLDTHISLAPGVAARRQKGQKANWSSEAKMRAYLIAESCMKQPSGTPYRDLYERGRLKYAEALHPYPCVRCGPAGKPAAVGTPLSAGHQHARSLRLVSKEILKDLWREAKRVREGA